MLVSRCPDVTMVMPRCAEVWCWFSFAPVLNTAVTCTISLRPSGYLMQNSNLFTKFPRTYLRSCISRGSVQSCSSCSFLSIFLWFLLTGTWELCSFTLFLASEYLCGGFYTVTISVSNVRIGHDAQSFFQSTAITSNELPPHAFPSSFNVSDFKAVCGPNFSWWIQINHRFLIVRHLEVCAQRGTKKVQWSVTSGCDREISVRRKGGWRHD